MAGVALPTGQIAWIDRRPGVVISSSDFIEVNNQLMIIVPCTTRDRGWDNHVRLTGPTGLTRPTFAITEQPRSMSVDRVHGLAGHVDEDYLSEIVRWVRAWQHSGAA